MSELSPIDEQTCVQQVTQRSDARGLGHTSGPATFSRGAIITHRWRRRHRWTHKLENAQTLQKYRSSEEVSAVTREKNWSAEKDSFIPRSRRTQVGYRSGMQGTADGLVKKCMKHGESGKDGKFTLVQILVGNLGYW